MFIAQNQYRNRTFLKTKQGFFGSLYIRVLKFTLRIQQIFDCIEYPISFYFLNAFTEV